MENARKHTETVRKKGSNTHNKLKPNTRKTLRKQAPSKKKLPALAVGSDPTIRKKTNTYNKLEPNISNTVRKQAPSKKKHTLYTAQPKSKENHRKHTETLLKHNENTIKKTL